MVTEILDDALLARVYRMAASASDDRPVPRLLRELSVQAAEILPADVVSVYMRENDDEGDVLVMRANVGFPDLAIGNVCLAIGEGITGLAAECMRPVMREHAAKDEHFRAFDGLDEERFPSFLAWPLLRGSQLLGVAVFQRGGGRPFTRADVALAGALTSNFLLALSENERRRSEARAQRTSEVGHEARLTGVGIAAGVALGRAELLPTIQQLVGELEPSGVLEGLERLRRQLDKDLARLPLTDRVKDELRPLRLVLEDARFSDQLLEEVSRRGLAAGLASLARRYALSANRSSEGDWLAKRAAEVSALCRLFAAHLAGRPLARPGAVLVLAERPGSLIALEAALRRVSAVAVADAMDPEALPASILRESRVPTVAEVAGLFDWLRPGDRVVVDGDAGSVWINPSEVRIAKTKSYVPKPD